MTESPAESETSTPTATSGAAASPVTAPSGAEPSLDQETALRFAVDRLSGEFDGVAEPAVIDDMLRAAYDHLAAGASLDNFVPLLAERYTREVLQAAVERSEQAPAHPESVGGVTTG